MIKHVLVCLDNVRDDDNTLQIAAKFSLSNDGRLIGLYIMVNPVMSSYHVYDHYTANLHQQIIEEGKKQAQLAEERFHSVSSKIG